ncbi:MAG: hypothetical protein H7Y17_15285 [Chlorobia bacterium]|nr:hypothetical protein [Fimbriimonadaceae bacterium]
MMKKIVFVGAAFLAVVSAFGQGPSPKQAFEQLKKLAGTWEMKGPAGESMKVHYKVSGAGNTLIETQFPGDAHEMVSVYHMDGKDLLMTHYCAAGNQPTMKYKPGKDSKVLFFDFIRGTNMKPKDMHIHTAKIMLKGKDQIQSDWTGFVNGKKGPTTAFNLKRVVE